MRENIASRVIESEDFYIYIFLKTTPFEFLVLIAHLYYIPDP